MNLAPSGTMSLVDSGARLIAPLSPNPASFFVRLSNPRRMRGCADVAGANCVLSVSIVLAFASMIGGSRRLRARQSTARKRLDLGLRNYGREDLEAALRAGEMLHVNVLGLATIAEDVPPELARATIASVSVLGALHASPAVKAALADRMR